jgi:protein TonB
MFSNLVESKPKSLRRRGGTLSSFAAHYGLILFMIYTSAQASTVRDGPRQEKIDFMEPEKPTVAKQEPPPPELVRAPLPPRSLPVLTAPLHIPNALPEIDLTKRATNPDDFVRRGPLGSEPAGSDSVPAATRDFYFDFQLEKPVQQAPNSATPVYPDILRRAGVEGEALVSFVVDTSGRVDLASFKLVRATHDLFAAAVRSALPRMRFIPAELGERKVRQLVQQPFTFTIAR